MYGIVLKDDSRIGAVYMPDFIPEDAIRVESLPEGDMHDYVYVDGEYIHDPLPKPEHQPTEAEKLEAQVLYTAMMTDTLLEEV